MKAKKIRLYYGIFLSVFTVVVAILFIVQTVSIYADGGWTNGAYTREIVAEKLFPISIPFYIWIAAIIAGYVLSVVYPYAEKPVNKISPRVTQRRLLSRIPQGEGEAYDAGMKRVNAETKNRLIAYSVCGALCLASAIASLVYICNPSNFTPADANGSMVGLLINVGPWLFVAFASGIAIVLFENYSLNHEIIELKSLIASNKGKPTVNLNKAEPAFLTKIKAVLNSKYFIWGLRGAVFVLAVTFIVLGIFNEGMRAVFMKAIIICKQCIGLG